MLLEAGGKVRLEASKNLVELSSNVLWKKELVCDEIGNLAEKISKQSVERMAWFLLTAYGEMQKKRDELKKESLSKEESKFKHFRKFSTCPFCKKLGSLFWRKHQGRGWTVTS